MRLDHVVRSAAVLIEFGGSIVIAVAVVRGLGVMGAGLGSRYAVVRGRLLVADGVVAALGYKTAATLLKTIELQSWAAIGMFAATLALRTVVKRVLVWEQGRLRSEDRSSADGPPGGRHGPSSAAPLRHDAPGMSDPGL